ncbi:DNA binding protein [Streptomyces phage Saftant]|uniref:DNA binding protein n=1 Tax=Streptomyces phage Saftant TaxID=2601693 RepID=A0A5J6D8J4_9CAUD|nr:hypothetical protein KGG95_gp29 [Streptomyces phage Saftant]QEQ94061.1 DNA binding protein [Streptomyces phage Saftant]
MAQIKVTVCDIDQTEVGKPTTRYTITRDGDRMEMDLCKDHAGPIETLLYEADKTGATVKALPIKRTPAKKASAPRRRSTAKVMTLEEIEALKQS